MEFPCGGIVFNGVPLGDTVSESHVACLHCVGLAWRHLSPYGLSELFGVWLTHPFLGYSCRFLVVTLLRLFNIGGVAVVVLHNFGLRVCYWVFRHVLIASG